MDCRRFSSLFNTLNFFFQKKSKNYQVLNILSEEERMAIKNDPFQSLEKVVEDKNKAAASKPIIQRLV